MRTNRKMRKSRADLRGFEGLETRKLLAADLFAANSTAPVEELDPVVAPADYVESSDVMVVAGSSLDGRSQMRAKRFEKSYPGDMIDLQ